MNIKEYQLETLRVLQEYMPQVRMIPDLINSLENRGLNELLPRQKDALTSFIVKSGKRKEIEQRIADITRPAKQVNTSIESNVSNTSPDYFKSPMVKSIEKLVPIGFQIPTTPTSRVEMFDKIFK